MLEYFLVIIFLSLCYNKHMNKNKARKYLKIIESIRRKYISLDMLANKIGIYSDIIANDLSYFDPLIKLDLDYNVKDLIPALTEYINQVNEVKESVKKEHNPIKKKQLEQYASVSDFIYKKLTISGFFDRNLTLNPQDLKVLRRLINEELHPKKKNK